MKQNAAYVHVQIRENEVEPSTKAGVRSIYRKPWCRIWTTFVESLGNRSRKEAKSGFEMWFEQIREDGRKLGIEVEPLTIWERISVEHDSQWHGRYNYAALGPRMPGQRVRR
jgi:hypothetical protein